MSWDQGFLRVGLVSEALHVQSDVSKGHAMLMRYGADWVQEGMPRFLAHVGSMRRTH